MYLSTEIVFFTIIFFISFLYMDLYEDLVDSVDRNSSSQYSKRAIIKLIAFQHQFNAEIAIIEPHIRTLQRKINICSSLSAILSTFATSGTVIELICEFLIARDDYIHNDPLTMIILIFVFIAQITATTLIAIMKIKDYHNEIIEAKDCVQDLHYLHNQIEQQIYCDDQFRTPIVELMKRIHHDHERIIKVQTNHLSINFSQAMDDVNLLVHNLSSRRPSIAQVHSSASTTEDEAMESCS